MRRSAMGSPYRSARNRGGGGSVPSWVVTPSSLPSGMVYTGASLKTQVNADGSLGYGPHNLVLQSQALSNAAWTLGNGATATPNADLDPAGQATCVTLASASGYGYSQQVIGLGLATYTASIYVKKTASSAVMGLATSTSGGSFEASFNTQTGVVASQGGSITAAGAIDAGNFWRIWATSVISNPTLRVFSGYPASVSPSVTWGQLNAGTLQPYYPTTSAAYYGLRTADYSDNAAVPGIKIEPQATNLALQSNALDSATWIKTRSSVTANAVIAPDGTLSADTLVEDATASSTHTASQAVSVTSGQTITFSIYVKAGARSWMAAQLAAAGGNGYSFFDCATGSFGSTGGLVGRAVVNMGNGWYRVSVSGVASATGNCDCTLYLATGGAANSYTGDGSSGVYFWGAQLETGSVATSYIPTAGSQVTRAADSLSWPTSAIPGFSASIGALVATAATNNFTGYPVLVDSTAASNVPSGPNLFAVYGGSDTVAQLPVSGSYANGNSLRAPQVTAGVHKFAMTYSAALLQVCRDGLLGNAVIPSATPSNTIALFVGGSRVNSDHLNGTLYDLRYYPTALPSATLQALTA